MRYLVFGDPHGNYLALNRLLGELNYAPGADRLIFVGDYIDHYRWNSERDAKKTVEKIIQLQKESPSTVFPIRGNHDDWFDEWIRSGGTPPLIWYSQGGKETIQSYYPAFQSQDYVDKEVLALVLDAIPQDHRGFFHDLPLYYYDEIMLVVHGGLPVLWMAKKFLEKLRDKESMGDLISMFRNNLLWDREWQKGTSRHRKILSENLGPNHLLIVGHTQGRDVYGEFVSGPFRNGNIINMDSFGLHCFVLDTETGEQYLTGVDDELK